MSNAELLDHLQQAIERLWVVEIALDCNHPVAKQLFDIRKILGEMKRNAPVTRKEAAIEREQMRDAVDRIVGTGA